MRLRDRLALSLTEMPKSRKHLCIELGCSDRSLRMAIKELRDSGIPVCTDSETGGYWIGDEKEIDRTVKELRARAYKLILTADRLERKAIAGQIEMEV